MYMSARATDRFHEITIVWTAENIYVNSHKVLVEKQSSVACRPTCVQGVLGHGRPIVCMIFSTTKHTSTKA